MRWWQRLIGRNRLERELDVELKFHVDEEAARLMREGLPAPDARRRALAAFGGLEPIKEQARDARGTRWIEDLLRDIRIALRLMRRQPGFTVAAVVSLALGIGANAAIFSVADALLLRRLPVQRPEELSFLNRIRPDSSHARFSYPFYQRIVTGAGAGRFAAMSATALMQQTTDRGAELAIGQLVSANFFDLLGVETAAGRTFVSDDAQEPDGRPVAVLSHGFWQRRFAADPAVIGGQIRLNNVVLTVVGVTAPSFTGMTVGSRVDLWMPLTLQHSLHYRSNASMDDAVPRKPWLPQEGISWLTVIMRASPSASTLELARIGGIHRDDIERRVAGTQSAERGEYFRQERLALLPGARGMSFLREGYSAPLYVLMGTAGIVLLIGCANLASLLLARGAARAREFTLRLSLGAGRGRIVRQLLAESLVLSLIGGMGGMALARWGAHALLRLASSSASPIPLALPIDWRFLTFTCALSLVAGLAFGLLPAFKLGGSSRHGLQSGSRSTAAAERLGPLPFGRALVVAQVALSVTLLVGAILFLRTFRNLLDVDTGFQGSQVLLARFEPQLAGLTEDQLPALYDRLMTQAEHIPGQRAASLAMAGAVSGWQRASDITIDGMPPRSGNDGVVREDFIGDAYFETLGIPFVRGRRFTPRDDRDAPKVAIVNEAMARKFFGDVDPIGKRFGYGTPDIEIVAVVRDARLDGLREPSPAIAFYPLRQVTEYAAHLYVRVDAATAEAARAALRRAVTEAEPSLAVREVATLAELANRTVSRERLLSQLTAVFGFLALGVACLGLYGTLSYSVVRRTKELGVRLALGALPSRVRWHVLQETMILVAIGAVAGLVLAALLTTSVASLLYGLSPRDPVTFALAIGVLVAVGAAAGLVPAWRASRVDPLVALRAE